MCDLTVTSWGNPACMWLLPVPKVSITNLEIETIWLHCLQGMDGGCTLLDSEAPPWLVFGDWAIRVHHEILWLAVFLKHLPYSDKRFKETCERYKGTILLNLVTDLLLITFCVSDCTFKKTNWRNETRPRRMERDSCAPQSFFPVGAAILSWHHLWNYNIAICVSNFIYIYIYIYIKYHFFFSSSRFFLSRSSEGCLKPFSFLKYSIIKSCFIQLCHISPVYCCMSQQESTMPDKNEQKCSHLSFFHVTITTAPSGWYPIIFSANPKLGSLVSAWKKKMKKVFKRITTSLRCTFFTDCLYVQE